MPRTRRETVPGGCQAPRLTRQPLPLPASGCTPSPGGRGKAGPQQEVGSPDCTHRPSPALCQVPRGSASAPCSVPKQQGLCSGQSGQVTVTTQPTPVTVRPTHPGHCPSPPPRTAHRVTACQSLPSLSLPTPSLPPTPLPPHCPLPSVLELLGLVLNPGLEIPEDTLCP